jgi:hypothetical protein
MVGLLNTAGNQRADLAVRRGVAVPDTHLGRSGAGEACVRSTACTAGEPSAWACACYRSSFEAATDSQHEPDLHTGIEQDAIIGCLTQVLFARSQMTRLRASSGRECGIVDPISGGQPPIDP